MKPDYANMTEAQKIAVADEILRSKRARRIESRRKFDEVDGRAMYKTAGRISSWQGEQVRQPSRLDNEGLASLAHTVWYSGPCTPKAILIRLCAALVAADLVDRAEALEIAGCDIRSFQRHWKQYGKT